MEALRVHARKFRQEAVRALGYDPEQYRLWAGQLHMIGIEADIETWPIYTADQVPLQDASGKPLFMFGLDSWGGTSPFG